MLTPEEIEIRLSLTTVPTDPYVVRGLAILYDWGKCGKSAYGTKEWEDFAKKWRAK